MARLLSAALGTWARSPGFSRCSVRAPQRLEPSHALPARAQFLPGGIRSSNALLTVLPDFDGDHIPDYWETLYGFKTNDLTDAASDPDLDGMSNYQEYIAGTDPLDRQSYLHIDAMGAIPGGGAILSFIAVSNKTYAVHYRDALETGAWQPLTNFSQSMPTNRVMVFTNTSPGAGRRWYRLVTP